MMFGVLYTDTPDETYNELTLKFKNELTAEGTKVYPSFTHGTALPWSASTSLQTQIRSRSLPPLRSTTRNTLPTVL